MAVLGEQECARLLAGFLKQRGSIVRFRRNTNDPPDFVFEVDGSSWGVEHTSIRHAIGTGSGSREVLGLEEARSRLCMRLSQELEGAWNGPWLLRFAQGDISKKRLRCVYEAVKLAVAEHDAALFDDYLRNSAATGSSSGPGQPPIAELTLLNVEGQGLLCMYGLGHREVTPGGRAPDDFHGIIEEELGRIGSAKRFLEDLGYAYDELVLLIESLYIFADAEVVRDKLSDPATPLSFADRVYLVWRGAVARVL